MPHSNALVCARLRARKHAPFWTRTCELLHALMLIRSCVECRPVRQAVVLSTGSTPEFDDTSRFASHFQEHLSFFHCCFATENILSFSNDGGGVIRTAGINMEVMSKCSRHGNWIKTNTLLSGFKPKSCLQRIQRRVRQTTHLDPTSCLTGFVFPDSSGQSLRLLTYLFTR